MSKRNAKGKLPVNGLKPCSRQYHDASIDSRVIREFVRRFPSLRFHSFQRNQVGSPRMMHCIRFIGLRDDMIAAGFPASGVAKALAKGFASSTAPLDWMLTRNRRRKAGTLEGQFWVWDDVRSPDHPMAWLEPRHWKDGRLTCPALERRTLAANVVCLFSDDRPAIVNPDLPDRLPRNVVRLDTVRQVRRWVSADIGRLA